MFRPQDLQYRSFFSFSNRLRAISPKGLSPKSSLTPDLMDILQQFDETIAERLIPLVPKSKTDVSSFEWVKSAIEALCAIQGDIRSLISKLDIPITNWDERWVDLYLDTTVNLLDLCIAFSSEIMRINQGNLFLQCASHALESDASNHFSRARSSLTAWSQMVSGKNPRMDNCSKIIGILLKSTYIPAGKISGKGKVLMSGMYGARVVTVHLCSVFATILTGDCSNMVYIEVPESYAWGTRVKEMQCMVNGLLREVVNERKVAILSEVNAVDLAVKSLGKGVEVGGGKNEVKELKNGVERLGYAMEILEKEVDALFKVVMAGRDALLSTLRPASLPHHDNFLPFRKQQKVV